VVIDVMDNAVGARKPEISKTSPNARLGNDFKDFKNSLKTLESILTIPWGLKPDYDLSSPMATGASAKLEDFLNMLKSYLGGTRDRIEGGTDMEKKDEDNIRKTVAAVSVDGNDDTTLIEDFSGINKNIYGIQEFLV
jgi:hypothetical protein